ncbi:peptidoglycan-binding protein [Phormidium sp. LEGE 05292]|uniref:peptidoglycan-binding domain-containing protein n=1 Tax=[Phormidium] sp. LEGE 05292 TaxID=767427 RepID=UPI00187F6E85|nr:peptidoglycan-binding protein [Phormidium sp. LEGE 05292]MBE9226759.1 peptidoglycan-binding protein [Phormidium sp. LEGE 05292]
MENLIYIHLASCQAENNEDVNFSANLDNVKSYQKINWKNIGKTAWIHLLSLVLTISTVGIATKAMAQMSQGTKGSEVAELQTNLQKLGYFDRRPTGHFGPLTKEAVIRFQQDEGITANGIVESTTLAALERKLQNNTTVAQTTPEPETEKSAQTAEPKTEKATQTAIDPNKQPNLRRGAAGPSVKALQQLLNDAGVYNGSIDGKFNLETAIAVRQFQRTNRLMVDGIVGPNTWAALVKGGTTQQALDPTFNNSPFTNGSLTDNADKPVSNNRTLIQASLKIGDRGQEVKDIQQRLKALGYYKGNNTGSFGSLTKQAVTRFQKQAGLTPNGIVDSSTKAALFTTINGVNDQTNAALNAEPKSSAVGENAPPFQQP